MLNNRPKLKKYDIKMEDVARIFNYSSAASLYSSKGRTSLIHSIEEIITIVEESIILRLQK